MTPVALVTVPPPSPFASGVKVNVGGVLLVLCSVNVPATSCGIPFGPTELYHPAGSTMPSKCLRAVGLIVGAPDGIGFERR